MEKLSVMGSIVLEEKERLESFIRLQEMKLNTLVYQLYPDPLQVDVTSVRLHDAQHNLKVLKPYIEVAEKEIEDANN